MQQTAIQINIEKLIKMIEQSTQNIVPDSSQSQAVIVIGDTGVGKSTIMSSLSGKKLVVRFQGLKPTLDITGTNNIKIGHQKYSETFIPTKLTIDGMTFFDCPGFNDNKGEEYQICNSFLIQKLLTSYKKVKILLVVDESHISEPRAQKLPYILRRLAQIFRGLQNIKNSCCMIINRCAKDHTEQDFEEYIRNLINKPKQQNLFKSYSEFLENLILEKRILLFRRPKRSQNQFSNDTNSSILNRIKLLQSTAIMKVNRTMSLQTKLAIRTYLDGAQLRVIGLFNNMVSSITNKYFKQVRYCSEIDQALKMKQMSLDLLQFKNQDLIMRIMQQENMEDKKFKTDVLAMKFFKENYNNYEQLNIELKNRLYSQFSKNIMKLDEQILKIKNTIINEINMDNTKNYDTYKYDTKIYDTKMRDIKISQSNQPKFNKQNNRHKKSLSLCAQESVKLQYQAKYCGTKMSTRKNNKRNLLQQVQNVNRDLAHVKVDLERIKHRANNFKLKNKQNAYYYEF